MTRGGKRAGAGRPKGSTKPQEQKSRTISITGYTDELEKVKEFVKKLKESR